MLKHALAAAALALLACAAQPPAIAEVPDEVTWTVAPDGDAGDDANERVQFSIGYRQGGSRSNWSSGTDLAELEGLQAAQLAGAGGPVRFRIVREAGRFDCDGLARQGRGTGTCRFAPDAAFGAALAQRGVGTPDRQESYNLALARVGIALVDEFQRQDYRRLSVGDLVSAGIHRIDVDYVRAMAAAGYRVGDVDALVSMRIHGVTPAYVRELADAGGTGYAAQDLVSMRIHGVTPQFVGELRTLGYEGLGADDLTAMRIHGITAAFARRAIAEAGELPTPDDLVSRRLHPGVRFGSR